MRSIRSIIIISLFTLVGIVGCSDPNSNAMETITLEKDGFNSFALRNANVVLAHLGEGDKLPNAPLPECISPEYSEMNYHPIVQFQFPDKPEAFVVYGLIESKEGLFCLFISVKSEGQFKECIDTSEMIGWGTVPFIVDKTYIELHLYEGKHSVTLVGTLPETNYNNCGFSISSGGEYEVQCWNGIP